MATVKHRKSRLRGTTASSADRYDLYLRAVQSPESEIPFFIRVYKREYDALPTVLREDFCGTFAVCCQWAKSRKDRIAIGVDIDAQPLDWGRKHNLQPLRPQQQQRVQLMQDDVRKVKGPKADVQAAQNFSFWIFKTRKELLGYFKAAYANLARKGVFVLDMMGGLETMEEDHTDTTSYKGFKYLWEQARFDPITHDCSFYIHFTFKDGSKLHRAFEYHWRFWMLPEVREVLLQAGFRRVDVYWEGTDSETEERLNSQCGVIHEISAAKRHTRFLSQVDGMAQLSVGCVAQGLHPQRI